ncbi:MAG: hypothetical protein L0216_01170 [Planctomycetales bacterium]|nr:hypothetical protein [Planctomycetales bacterium]
MPARPCPSCGRAVEIPEAFSSGKVACPECGAIFVGPAEAPASPAPPRPPVDPAEHAARVAEVAEEIRASGRYRLSHRVDTGGMLAMGGMMIAIPALFAGPFVSPLFLAGPGMALGVLGLFFSRDKFLGFLAILLSAAFGAGGIVFRARVAELLRDLGIRA